MTNVSTTVCKYFTTREKMVATALLVSKLEIKDRLPIRKEEQSVMDQLSDQLSPSPLTPLQSDGIDDNSVLSDIFNSPDCPPLPPSTPPLSEQQFARAVLSINGVVGMLVQCQPSRDKLDILDSGCQAGDGDHLVYVIFSFISQRLISVEKLTDTSFNWMKDAVTTTIQLINTGVEHQFVTDSMDISTEFLRHSLSSLAEMQETRQYSMVVIISMMGANKMLGKLVVTFLLSKFTETAGRLREAQVYRYADNTMETFTVYMNLMLEIWPFFANEVCPPLAGGKPAGKRKERTVKPRLSLGETTQLADEVAGWREVLDQCMVGLTVLQPEFCEAVWRVDQFCQGIISSLTKQS